MANFKYFFINYLCTSYKILSGILQQDEVHDLLTSITHFTLETRSRLQCRMWRFEC